jgi:hypothetical protein
MPGTNCTIVCKPGVANQVKNVDLRSTSAMLISGQHV